MRVLHFCGLAAVLLLVVGCQRDISGTYLASDQNAVCWLQLVRTPDNHLTGQLSASTLKPDSSIVRDSVSLTGAVNGENVTLSGSRFLGLETITLSGTFEGSKLTLTGVQATPVILKRSSLDDYQSQLKQLNARSQTIIAARAAAVSRQRTDQAQRNFVAEIDQLISRMQRFDSEADLRLSRFPGAEEHYHALTAKMTDYVERERQLASNPNASNTRGQLSTAASQVSVATEQMHIQGQTLQSSLETNVKPIADEETKLDGVCHESGPSSSNLTQAQVDERNSACNRLSNAAGPFRQKYDAIVAGLSHLEQVYRQETSTQQGLLQTAERLE